MTRDDLEVIVNAVEGAENRLSAEIQSLRGELDILSSRLGFPPKNFEIANEGPDLIQAKRSPLQTMD